MATETEAAIERPFDAEVGRLLDLVVHSLYSDREIFLRELVANAADAIDRRRFLALSDEALALPAEAAIRIRADHGARTITIADDGIGMTAEDLASHLGTIARSGTRAFTDALAEARPEDRPTLIGQFGVGFYSAFMVAEKVEVISRRAGTTGANAWVSDGRGGGYRITHAEREAAGTDVILHLKADATEYLDGHRLETIIRKWADHVAVPISIERDGKLVKANEGAALWRRPKSEIKEEEYADFYRHLGHLFDSPWATIHWRAEGTVDFAALLFIPGHNPFQATETDRDSHVRLHVRRMFITDSAKMLPSWLRFVEGVVDTEDLPLNVSREMLQSTPVLGRIRKALVNRVLAELKSRSKDETYKEFCAQFGAVLKEGIYDDVDHRNEIASLVRFSSTASDAGTSFDDYIERMKPGQDAIYYLTGEDPAQLAASPLLEGVRAHGFEVLLLADSIDFFWPERLGEYREKKLVHVAQASDLFEAKPVPADMEQLIKSVKEILGDTVSDVRVSFRLTDSPAVLTPGSNAPDLAMQRLMRRAGRQVFASAPVLEINPGHALVERMVKRGESGQSLDDVARLLFDLARIQEGEPPVDTARFVRSLAAYLVV